MPAVALKHVSRRPPREAGCRVGTERPSSAGSLVAAPPPDKTASTADAFAPFERELAPERERGGAIDAGTLMLEHGVVLHGRLIDADGGSLAGMILRASSKQYPYADRETRSLENGTFVFAPLLPSIVTLSVDARLRDAKGEVVSRDVHAVFAPLSVTLTDAAEPIVVRAERQVILEFEWIDRRQPLSERMSYYNAFRVSGIVPGVGNEPVAWSGETERNSRDGREIIFIKVPANLLAAQLTLPSDAIVRAMYQEGDDPIQEPGIIPLGDITKSKHRVIYGYSP